VNATFARARTVALIALFGTFLVVAVATIGILGIRSATHGENVVAGGELDTAVTTNQLAREIDAAYAAGEAVVQADDPATRSRLLGTLYTSLLPGVDAQLFALQQLHAGDPPAERADLALFIRQWDTVRDLLTPQGLTARPPAALAGQLAAAYQPVSAHLDRLVLAQLGDARADRTAASAYADRSTDLILGAAGAGIAMAWLFLWYEFWRIRRSLQPVQDQAEFAGTLQLADDEDEAHRLLQRHLERTLPATIAVVLNRNNSADRLEAVTPLPPGSPLTGTLRGAEPRSCLAVRSGRMHSEREGRPPLLSCPVCAPVPGASSCAPLMVGGEVIGSVLASRPSPYSEAENQRIRESVGQAAPVLANLRNLAVAEIRAATDGLTGLPNKRAVTDALKRMFAQATMTQSPFALIMLDLDHFKQVNDQHGHAAGDQVLAGVGTALRGALRSRDFAGRNGGEEFAILLPDTDVAAALEIAERIRATIAEITVPGTDVPVTVSVGVAGFPDHTGSLGRLERLADAALYVAKRQGRNRVELASAEAGSDLPGPRLPEPAGFGAGPVPDPVPRGLTHAPDSPQVGERGRGQGGAQVGGAGRATGTRPAADRPLHHLDVVVAPLLHALVQVDQQLAHRGGVGVVVVDPLQRLLHRVGGLERRGDVALADLGGHVVALPGQVAGEGVEHRRPRHGRGDALPLGRGQRGRREHLGVPAAQHRFQLAELRRLEPAGGAEPVAEPGELGRRHGLEHVQLGHHDLQDGQRPP
jgi:diguanylate cyclase (GGDEF)-like protein